VTAKQFKAIRRRLGLSQRALAETLGLHPNSVARLERGEMTITTLVANFVTLLAKTTLARRGTHS
jgi:transcriptional regulator with XRE-family HTH domain